MNAKTGKPEGAREPRRARARRLERGMSLVETALSMVVLAVACLTALSVLVSSMELDAVNRETKVAFDAARSRIETVRAERFNQVVASFNADPSDDPAGAGTAPGPLFAVADLPQTAAGALQGTIVLPVDGAGTVRENLSIPALGMPRDLNGDGVVDGDDHTADAIVLPVLVRVRWNGASGSRESVLSTVLRP